MSRIFFFSLSYLPDSFSHIFLKEKVVGLLIFVFYCHFNFVFKNFRPVSVLLLKGRIYWLRVVFNHDRAASTTKCKHNERDSLHSTPCFGRGRRVCVYLHAYLPTVYLPRATFPCLLLRFLQESLVLSLQVSQVLRAVYFRA